MRVGAIVIGFALIVLVVFLVVRRGPEEEPEVTETPLVDEGERIVSLVPSTTEILFALGVGDRVVGRSVHSDYPPEVESIESVGSGIEPDVERIIALRPTLVVGGAMQEEYPAIAALRDAGIDVLLVPDQTLFDIRMASTTLGERLDRVAAGEAIVQSIDASLAEIADHPPFEGDPSVVVVVGTDPIFVAGNQTYIDPMVRMAGGSNHVFGDWIAVDDEAFVAMQPDILIALMDDPSELSTWDRFGESVPAVRDGRVCGIDRDTLARPGPRIPAAARAVGRCIVENWPISETAEEEAPTAP